jgi:hypothetical protein
LKGFPNIMASLGDGVGYLSSTSLVLRVVTSTTAGDGPVGKGTWTSQVPNARITENKVILAKDEWKCCGITIIKFLV